MKLFLKILCLIIIYACVFPLQTSAAEQSILYDKKLVPVLREVLPLNIDQTKDLTNADKENVECLAWNLYFEARGGTVNEQIAVAHVPINRTKVQHWSADICENVFQYNYVNGRKAYQFIWAGFNISPKWRIEYETWQKVQLTAYKVYRGELADPSNGAIYFNHHSVGGGRNSIRIGSHLFFK
jgi:spore germination cell wall hydrolase CwlJ-like protein